MTRTSDRKTRAAALSGAALAAVTLGSAGLAAPPVPPQQKGQPPASSERSANFEKWSGQRQATNWIKLKSEYKHKGEYAVAGENGGRIIFQDNRGNLFYVDEATGDQKFVSSDLFLKIKLSDSINRHIHKAVFDKVTILGTDDSGRPIMRNKRGEVFQLDAATGDMIFAK